MALDETSIYNLALNAIGARNNVTLPTERSREAQTCRLWYPLIRDATLAAAPWPSAKSARLLSLLEQKDFDLAFAAGDPKPGYPYVYAVPEDMLRPQYLEDYTQFELTSYPNNIQAISTLCPNPVLIYTSRQENISLWDAQLQLAIVYALAAHICSPLSGKRTLASDMVQKANALIMAAREGAANTDDIMPESIPEWIMARGYRTQVTRRYLYPFGATFNLSTLTFPGQSASISSFAGA